MSTVNECIEEVQEVINHYKRASYCHQYGERSVKHDIAKVTQLVNKVQGKCEEIRINRNLQNYIDKLKPLLRAEQLQKSLEANKITIHKSGGSRTVTALKLSIRHASTDAGLKCVEGGSDSKCYISFDANEFYLEISFPENNQEVGLRVSLVQEGAPNDQPHMATALDSRDFSLFGAHLRGYASVFNIPLEPRTRPALFNALRSLETDLLDIGRLGDDTIGQVIPAKDGIGARIQFLPINSQNACSNNCSSVEIGVECSTIHQLPTQPIFLEKSEFKPLSPINSEYIEASFVMRLQTPLVFPLSCLNKLLEQLGNTSLVKPENTPTSYMDLLTDRSPSDTRTVRNQVEFSHDKLGHRYFVDIEEKAVCVHRIPFSHPSQVRVIISRLRQQATYNQYLLSCKYLSHTKKGADVTVDITGEAGENLELMFAHPQSPRLCTLNIVVAPKTNIVHSSDTALTGVLCEVLSQYTSLPLLLHGALRILTHHHNNNISVVPERKELSPRPGHPPYTLPVVSSASPSSQFSLSTPTSDFAFSPLRCEKVDETATFTAPTFEQPPVERSSYDSPPISMPDTLKSMPISMPDTLKSMPISMPDTLKSMPISMPDTLKSMPISMPDTLKSMPISMPDTLKPMPSPPDIIAGKRKRQTVPDPEEPLLKKPNKLKMCEPGIPVLSPMATSLPTMSTSMPAIRMANIGPPSLKPAPVHSTSTQGSLGNIPCLSPAPHMVRAPMSQTLQQAPQMQGSQGMSGSQGGIPTLQNNNPNKDAEHSFDG